MVKAILEGRKTQTRRVLKEPFEIHPNGFITKRQGNERLCPYNCPYGEVGDFLWVRETFFKIVFPGGEAFLPRAKIYYKASEYRQVFKWRPSIFMPRWASRISKKR